MLQLLHVSVAKVDLNVGLFSEEERDSVGSHGSVGCKLAAALHRRMHRRPRWSTRHVPLQHDASASPTGGPRVEAGMFPYGMLAPLEVLEEKLVASLHATEM
jgi:hypothetical protein